MKMKDPVDFSVYSMRVYRAFAGRTITSKGKVKYLFSPNFSNGRQAFITAAPFDFCKCKKTN